MSPLYKHITDVLSSGIYPPLEAKTIARFLLESVCGFSALDLYDDHPRQLSKSAQDELDSMLHRLCQYEPLQYVLGYTEFMGLRIELTKDVLIPRPETAELVQWVIDDLGQSNPCRILDVGTGSGCIALALATNCPHCIIMASDFSESALGVARNNALLHNVPISFLHHDIMGSSPLPQVDVIVSNPPYITEKEKSGMEPNVLLWEPGSALFVPDNDPLCFYRKIAQSKTPTLYFEINQTFGQEVMQLLRDCGYTRTVLRKDLSGNDRMIKATR